MEIQQWGKESLAACIHQFKTEAKGCNFTNDATTIRIFIKGLKNAYSLATCIYEKGPQTLIDVISEVGNLNAVQQLTAMIILPSMVNVMSCEEDSCFQCKEQGHIHEIALILKSMSVMNMITLSWIVHTGYLLQVPQWLITNPNLLEVTMPNQVQGTTMKTGTGEANPDHNVILQTSQLESSQFIQRLLKVTTSE